MSTGTSNVDGEHGGQLVHKPATIATFNRPLLRIGRLMTPLVTSPPPTMLIVDLLEPAMSMISSLCLIFFSCVLLRCVEIETVGSWWVARCAACRFMKGLDMNMYDIVRISPRNHMVFTPLLPSTCVETLEFRSVAEPVSQIQPALAATPNSHFYLASYTVVDTENHEQVYCETVGNGRLPQEPNQFKVAYDKLVITAGAEPLTFGIKSVMEHAYFLRGVVKEVHAKKIVPNDGTDVPYDLPVWSTSVGPSEFIKSLNLPKSPGGRIEVDEWMRVPTVEDVFALGDCAGFLEQTGRPVLPAFAQVAEREGKFLEELFRRIGKQNGGKAFCSKEIPLGDPFVYKHLGSMASVGCYKALINLRQSKDDKGISHVGFVSWLVGVRLISQGDSPSPFYEPPPATALAFTFSVIDETD
ncbi:hypothetical protein NL676_007976 [Syzygium grande]|nr:hypothetical protein NL676_007976 [Syzygium grande]